MNKLTTICMIMVCLFGVPRAARADWQRAPASDVDKEFISGDPGLQPGVPSPDNSCWMAAASNMLAGAGYGNGATIQQRAEDIYIDMMIWRAAVDPTNTTGVRDGGWMDNALTWWLGSANNTLAGTNPYTVVTTYGNYSKIPWANSNGARYIANQLRDYQSVGLSISRPRTTASGSPSGGHAIAAWGDSGGAANLAANPPRVIVADSDRDTGGDFQTYTYDSYTNPNPAGFDEGNGWYFNYASNHWFIKHITTLCPTDSPVDPHDGPTQKVVGSYRIHQNNLESATDLHYTAYTDYDILGYRTEIDWPTANDPVITESDTHYPHLARSDIHVDWDLTDNPVPYCKDVTITTEFILQNWNGIRYSDVHFTYPGGQSTKYLQPPYESPFGTDIRVDNHDDLERLLADDFRCIRRGPITRIYLWGSWKDDFGEGPAPGNVKAFHLAIYSDDPIGDEPDNPSDDPTNEYSRPLKLLWSGTFNDFLVSQHSFVQEEYFWDSYRGTMGWDNRIWSYVIDIPTDQAFEQRGSRKTPVVYWLAVSAEIDGQRNPEFGWKTTDPENGWNDTAVMWDGENWKPLFYPANHRLADHPVDMSFGIVTSASQPGIALPEFGWNIYTPELENTAAPDITGGYVIGTFDIFNTAGEPNLLGQYRFVHQYPYTQDPERHVFTIEGPTDPSGPCADFDDLAIGTVYHVPDVFTTQGYPVECKEFFWSSGTGTTNGFARVHPTGGAGGSGLELELNNINAEFDFGGQVECVSFLFGEYGGNLNIEVNGDFKNFQNFADINGSIIGGCSVTVTNGHGNDTGKVVISGSISQFKVGGQELQIDDVCPFCDQQDGCGYMATNFKFGHSYGMPDAESLWEFNRWMTASIRQVNLCSGKPFQFVVDWEGRLPYPHSDITPADEIPEQPDCTVYLPADLNKDCCVNFKDFQILADDWLQCSTY